MVLVGYLETQTRALTDQAQQAWETAPSLTASFTTMTIIGMPQVLSRIAPRYKVEPGIHKHW